MLYKNHSISEYGFIQGLIYLLDIGNLQNLSQFIHVDLRLIYDYLSVIFRFVVLV